jgi:O-6-methylguanine DNA methyltransferase
MAASLFSYEEEYTGEDSEHMGSFTEKVLKAVAKIPKGKTLTYAEVARRAEIREHSAPSVRLCGNYDPAIPCHRVIRSDGSFGGYNRGGPAAKARTLRAEGAIEQEEIPKIRP